MRRPSDDLNSPRLTEAPGFKALEGPVITAECVEDKTYCLKTADCVARQLWTEVQNAIMNVLDSMTLQDLVDKAKDGKKLSYQI